MRLLRLHDTYANIQAKRVSSGNEMKVGFLEACPVESLKVVERPHDEKRWGGLEEGQSV